MAIAPTQPAAKSSGTNLFGSLFSSGSAEKKGDGPIDRVARLIGLGGKDQDTKKAEAAPAPAPKPKPAAKPTSVASSGAIRAKQAEAAPIKTTEAKAPAQTAAASAPASTAMNGSAPVVPTGNFDNRWSGFR
jgi:hypothetical protein